MKNDRITYQWQLCPTGWLTQLILFASLCESNVIRRHQIAYFSTSDWNGLSEAFWSIRHDLPKEHANDIILAIILWFRSHRIIIGHLESRRALAQLQGLEFAS